MSAKTSPNSAPENTTSGDEFRQSAERTTSVTWYAFLTIYFAVAVLVLGHDIVLTLLQLVLTRLAIWGVFVHTGLSREALEFLRRRAMTDKRTRGARAT